MNAHALNSLTPHRALLAHCVGWRLHPRRPGIGGPRRRRSLRTPGWIAYARGLCPFYAMRPWFAYLAVSGMIGLGFARLGAASALDYNRDIRPILSENCFAC